MAMSFITIYTDGSCHTQLKIGAWAAVILIANDKKILTGTVINTTHQRMELTAVIEALSYVQHHFAGVININLVTDSQYVIGLPERRQKLQAASFITKQGQAIQNADLVQQLYKLSESFNIDFVKIQAHLKKTSDINYNIEVDKLCRKMVREQASQSVVISEESHLSIVIGQ